MPFYEKFFQASKNYGLLSFNRMTGFFRSICSTGKCLVVRSLVLFFLIFSGFSFPVESLPSRPSETIYNRQNLFPEKFFLNVDNGLITLIARNNPLGPVLDEIGRRTGEKIKVSPTLRTKTITVNWKDIPFEEGINKIAEDTGLFFGRNEEEGSYYLSEFKITPETSKQVLNKHEKVNPSGLSSAGSALSGAVLSQDKSSGDSILLNEMVIRFRQGISEQDINQLLSDANITVKKYIAPLKCHILSLPEGMSSYDAMVLFKNKKMLYQSEHDYLIPVK